MFTRIAVAALAIAATLTVFAAPAEAAIRRHVPVCVNWPNGYAFCTAPVPAPRR